MTRTLLLFRFLQAWREFTDEWQIFFSTPRA